MFSAVSRCAIPIVYPSVGAMLQRIPASRPMGVGVRARGAARGIAARSIAPAE